MSDTTRCRISTQPGAAFTTPVPNLIEQADPGGVNTTMRISSVTWWSRSTLNPTFST
jgi:hypothetical protein